MRQRADAAFIGFAIMALGAAFSTEPVAAQTGDGGLVAHEWGTFTTVAGKDGRAIDWLPLSGTTDLPCFVHHFQNDRLIKVAANTRLLTYQEARASVLGKVRMETPVIYFYSPRETSLSVRVQFPRGLMTEWYPQASLTQNPITSESRRAAGQTSILEWPQVRITPSTKSAFPADVAESHYYAARATDAAPLSAGGQAEKFLFYRGVADFDVPLTAEVHADGAVRIGNLAAQPLSGVILFENRNGAIGYRMVGKLQDNVTVAAPALGASFSTLRAELEQLLVSAGLYPKEAAAMVETWRDSWFEEGMRVFYIVPDAAVAAILPLTITPAPAHIARVFVGRMDVITPAMINAVEQAIDGDSDDVLDRFGRLLEPITDRILERRGNPALRGIIAELRRGALARYLSASAKCN